MFRTAATLGVVAVAGLVVLKIALGMIGGIFGVLLTLAWFVFKLLVIVGLGYFVLKLVSPDTARRLEEKFSGPEQP
jgi:hypothetical protein